MRPTLAALVLVSLLAPLAAADWQHTVEVPRPPRKGKEQAPAIGHLWLPSGELRGLLVAGKTLLEKKLCADPAIRQTCADAGLGVLYFEPHFDAIFNYVKGDCEDAFLASLDRLAAQSSRPEVATVPWLTMGHSTGGIFCRNVAYWRPERVIGVIMIKSGNFQDHIPDPTATLAGVPLLIINGEIEEYGPAGGDLKGGHRTKYSTHPSDPGKDNQTQWILARAQMAERRRKNPDNLWSLVVDRGKDHTAWGPGMTPLCCRFIASAVAARIPATISSDAPVRCTTLTEADGWLSDADIKAPRFATAPAADYQGPHHQACWHPDQAMAEAWTAYHAGPWTLPDPSASEPDDVRWVPEQMLRDAIDGP